MVSQLDIISTLYLLLRHPRASREEIVAFQNKRLRRLITHAYENVTYYRRLFDQNGIKPKDIQSVADLSLIPITSKKNIQSLPAEEVVAHGVNPKSLITHRTSGSSGEPLTIRRAWLEARLRALFRLRAMHYFGQRLTDKLARVGLVHSSDYRDNQFPMRVVQMFGLYRWQQINSLQPRENIVRTLRHFRPDILMGSPGVLTRLAEIISDEDRQIIRPRFVRISGEVATPLMRRQIIETFNAPVFDVYSARELGMIAWECKETSELHTCDDKIIVEVLKDGSPAAPGERGEVVGTNLYSFAMPFIRYRLGDIVTKGLETCRCGQPFSTIGAVQGRMIDYFQLPGGRMIHPYEIEDILEDDESSWIHQFQLIQEREDRVILHVVPSTTIIPQKIVRLEESVKTLLGQEVEFQVIPVSEIKLEPTGKFRYSRSHVKSAYEGIDWDQLQSDEQDLNGKHGNELE